jgi:methylisocitrate lyase
MKELVTRPNKILSVMHFPTAGLARTMESAGAEAGFVGTSGVVGNITGMADLGQITMTEVLQVAGWIANSVKVPTIMDGDTGHGSIMAVRRMIKDAINAGVSGIRIDDRAIEVDKEETTGMGSVVGMEYALTRFRAAVDMREEMGRPDFFIIAQSDAREAPNGSLEDAIERMVAYEQTGVDLIQMRHPRDAEDVRKVRAALKGPFGFMLMKGGVNPSLEEQMALGAQMAWFPGFVADVLSRALYEFVTDFQQKGVAAHQDFVQRHPKGPPRYEISESPRRMHELEKRYFVP